MEWSIIPLDSPGYNRSSLNKAIFNCGEKEKYRDLDRYLKQLAWKNNEIGLAKTFVASLEEDRKRIIGYYSVSMSLIETKALPDDIKKSLPGFPIPAMLIGKLAVDKSAQGIGVGKSLLKHAFQSAIEVSQRVGIYAIRIDAKDKESKKYYVEKRGFLQLNNTSLEIFIPMVTVKKMVQLTQESSD